MARVKLASPWVIYYEQVKALFGDDPDVVIYYDDDAMELSLYVDSSLKASALEQLLPTEKQWGDTVLSIRVVPGNQQNKLITVQYHMNEPFETSNLMYYALCDNPHFKDVIHLDAMFDINYVVFKNEVIQYYSDNLGDPHGLTSTLAQDIAKEIFETPNGVFYCTDIA